MATSGLAHKRSLSGVPNARVHIGISQERGNRRMRIFWDNGQHSLRAVIFPIDGNNYTCVRVERQKEYDSDSWRAPTVNWSALGSVDHNLARVYGKAIVAAADIATKFTHTPKLYCVIFSIPDQEQGQRTLTMSWYATNPSQLRSQVRQFGGELISIDKII